MQQGDLVKIIHKDRNGLWTGQIGDIVGLFKFIHVDDKVAVAMGRGDKATRGDQRGFPIIGTTGCCGLGERWIDCGQVFDKHLPSISPSAHVMLILSMGN